MRTAWGGTTIIVQHETNKLFTKRIEITWYWTKDKERAKRPWGTWEPCWHTEAIYVSGLQDCL
jgi:hypothetical protein